MKTVTRRYVRSKRVAGVLASLRIEDLTPSPEVVAGLTALMQGKTTTAELIEKVRLKHVTLRRV
jgi:hypothetical protein